MGWYCAKLTSTSSNWCKRQEILEKMQKIHYSTTDTALAQERKSLAAQYSEFSKPASGGGPSKMSLIAKEISDAKKQYLEMDRFSALLRRWIRTGRGRYAFYSCFEFS